MVLFNLLYNMTGTVKSIPEKKRDEITIEKITLNMYLQKNILVYRVSQLRLSSLITQLFSSGFL
jgi:uncharacterized lipoprotein YmbA